MIQIFNQGNMHISVSLPLTLGVLHKYYLNHWLPNFGMLWNSH